MKAVIMAGGEGTRLRPVTCGLPKPMTTILSVPAVEMTIALLRHYGVLDVALTLKYLPQKITDYFGDGKNFGVRLYYFVEDEPLGTAGSVKNAESFLDEDFLILSGDALCDLDLKSAVDFHYKNDAFITIELKREQEPLEYGVAVCDGCEVKRFVEKPSWPEVFSDTVNTGAYVMDKSVLSMIPAGKSFDFSKDLFPVVLKNGRKICGHVTEKYWCDIGDTKAYLKGCFDLLDGKLAAFGRAGEKIAAGRKNTGFYGVTTHEPVFVAEGAMIQKGCEIGPYAVIEENAVISPGCRIKNSVVKRGAFLARGCEVKGAVICDGAEIQKNAAVFEGAVVGEGTVVGEGASILPGTKIWPHKKIESGRRVAHDTMWGEMKKPSEVLSGGLFFDAEREMSPHEFISFGHAVGRLFPGGRTVVACDGNKIPEILKDMVCAGILCAGGEAVDAKAGAQPSLSKYIRTTKKAGGVYLSETDGKVFAQVFSGNGLPIQKDEEKKLEKLLEEDENRPRIGAKVSHKVSFDGIDDFYLSDLAREFRIKNTIPIGLTGDLSRLHALTRSTLEKSGADVVEGGRGRMNLSVSGNEVRFLDENSREVEKERLWTLLSLILSETEGEILLPASFPYSCERVLREKGKDYRLVSRIPMITEQNAVFFDPAAAALCVAWALSERKTSLSKLINELPNVYYERDGVFCDHADKGRVMRFLIEETGADPTLLLEGITVTKPRGAAVRIIPDRIAKSYSILAEAFSQEYAKEIAADYAQKIRSLTENKSSFQS